MTFLGFVVAACVGLGLLALMLKFLDLQGEAADRDEARRTADAVPLAETLAAKMPAFFRRPPQGMSAPSKFVATERLPRLHEIDQRHIMWALGRAGGNHSIAAVLLGLSDTTFEVLCTRHCGESPAPQPEIDTRESLEDRLFAFIQNHIQAEQALVSEFIHLPSIDNLYRQAGPSFSAR